MNDIKPPAWAETGIDHAVLVDVTLLLANLPDHLDRAVEVRVKDQDSRDLVDLCIKAALAFQERHADQEARSFDLTRIDEWAGQVWDHVMAASRKAGRVVLELPSGKPKSDDLVEVFVVADLDTVPALRKHLEGVGFRVEVDGCRILVGQSEYEKAREAIGGWIEAGRGDIAATILNLIDTGDLHVDAHGVDEAEDNRITRALLLRPDGEPPQASCVGILEVDFFPAGLVVKEVRLDGRPMTCRSRNRYAV